MASQRLGSILAGAGTGALAGLGGGPLGALIGALTGGAGGYFGGGSKKSGGLFDIPSEEKRFERFTPGQQQLTELLRNILTGEGKQPEGGLLGSLLGEEGFRSFADPAMRLYQQEIVPKLAERFSGGLGVPGAASAQRSSGFQQALARSGENLATRLGEVRGQQQQGLLESLLGQTMQPQFHTRYEQGGASPLAQGLGGIGGNLGQLLGPYLSQLFQRSQVGGF